MVLKLFILFTLLTPGFAFTAKSTAKLKIYRSKIVKAIKRSPYFKQRMGYSKYRGYVKKIKSRRKLSKATLEGFLNLSKIDTYLYAKTRKKFFYEQGLKSAYLLAVFGYKKSESKKSLGELKRLRKVISKKKLKPKTKKKKRRKKRKKKRRRRVKIGKKWSMYSQFVSWQEDRLGLDSTGGDFLLIAQLKGLCTGMSYDFSYKNLHFRTSGCLIFPGSVDIANENPSTYTETDILSPGFIVGTGMIYEIYPKQLNFGFNIDLLGRMSKFEPTNLESVDGETMITLGAAGSVEMIRDEKYGLEFKAGYGMAFTSIYWQIGLRYYY